jgi:ribosomal protein S18 acetylase RimI-like enzyme
MDNAGDVRFEQLDTNRVKELKEIALQTFTQSFFHLNTPENFNAYVSEAFDEETLTQEINSPGTLFYFIYFQSRLAGYFKINIHSSSRPETDINAMELQRIYLLNQFQGTGLGSRMLAFVMDKAKANNCRTIWLGVWEHNVKAIRFYENHGFIKTGEHTFLLGQDPQTDYIYTLNL